MLLWHNGVLLQYRQEGAEAQQGASRHCIQHPLASASHAQLRQQRNPAPGSIPSVAWQDSRTTPHLQQQQQLDVGFTLTAANALSSLGHHEVADAEDLDAAPQQQNSHQPSLNPACTDVDEQSLSCEQCAQRPGQDDGRAEAEVHAGVMGDEMCAPIELTWEGVQASSGNNQVAPHPGDPTFLPQSSW